MKETEKKNTPYEREVKKRRLLLEILILVFTLLLGIMITGLINSAIKAYRIAQITPTPVPTLFARITKTPTPTPEITPTPGPVVMVDPGHGGIDVGTDASGTADVYEKTINLSIGLKVREKLEALGFTVLMTREEDVTLHLDDRLILANETDISAFVSIHLNSAQEGDVTSSGCEVYYNSRKNENSQLMAECIVNEICNYTGARNRGVKDNTFEVLQTSKPAVLVECGFMSSETEYPYLKDDGYQDLIADGIVEGLLKYYKKLNGVNRKDE